MSDNKQYVVSARKYRPATFRTVVGQRHLTDTLKNAIETKRLAQAYLFCGPRGVGKTSCARIFARTINCLNPGPDGEACGKCASCVSMDQGNSFNIIELDAASNNSVDDIRSLTEQVNVPPQIGNYRVFIIDEVHMLSTAAFNAFLKTLEEPPKYVIFILATTEKHKVLPTILSRCQVYDFKRITIDDMAEHLAYVASQEGITAEPEALNVIARKADGAMRDALSIFDQVTSSTRGNLTYEATIANLNVLDYDYYFRLVEAFTAGDVPQALLIYKDVLDKGFDSHFFLSGLASHVRDLMVSADPATTCLLEVSGDVAKRYTQQATSLPVQWYYAALRILNDSDVNYRTSTNKRLLTELTLIRLCQLLKPATPPFDAPEGLPPLRDPLTTTGRPASISPATPTTAAPQVASQAASQAAPQTNHAKAHSSATVAMPHHPAVPTRPATTASASPSARRIERPQAGISVAVHAAASRQATPKPENRDNPFDDSAFRKAWDNFIATNPSQHILVSAMRTAQVTRTDARTYNIKVDHPAGVQAFESQMKPLLASLRDALANDFISLTVTLNDAPDPHKKLAPAEFLKKIVAENPDVAGFLKRIDAELS